MASKRFSTISCRWALSTSTHHIKTRGFTSTIPARGSPLFALAALSNSRESQHFRKITRLSQIEHSTPLQFIRSSEGLDPAVTPIGAKSPRGLANGRASKRRSHATAPRIALTTIDANALSIGRTLIANHAQRVQRLQRLLKQMDVVRAKESAAWTARSGKLERENRTAIGFMLTAIGVATTLALWRFGEARKPRTSLAKVDGFDNVLAAEGTTGRMQEWSQVTFHSGEKDDQHEEPACSALPTELEAEFAAIEGMSTAQISHLEAKPTSSWNWLWSS